MAFRVSAITQSGGAVSVIVPDRTAALVKIADYRDDGFSAIVLKDLDGKVIDAAQLAGEGPPADSE